MGIFKKSSKASGADGKTEDTIKKLNLDNVESISPTEFKDITWDVLHHSGHHHSSSHHHHHHHHHHHSNEEAEKENSVKLTDFSSEEIRQRTDEYTSAHRIDRSIPKHPHRHDKIAHDAKYSGEELDELNADKIDSYGDTGVEEFKKDFDKRISESSHHHHHHHHSDSDKYQRVESSINSDDTESFDTDKFLSDFQKSGSSSHHHHHHHSHSSEHSSSHHHSTQSRDKDVASMSEVGTKDFFAEYQKTKKENEQLKKQLRLEKIRSEMSE